MKLKSLIVDDEPLARKGLREYISETPSLEFIGECRNANEAVEFLKTNVVDIMFLDIQMPHVTGLEFLRTLDKPPITIITTAYPEFAIEGFELDVMDFLVKPIPYQRFSKAITKAIDYYNAQHAIGEEHKSYIFVKSAGKFERIYFEDILFVEALQNYVVINLKDQKHIVYLTLSGMESSLPATEFMRVHKSYIVSLKKVNSIEDHDLLIGKNRIPVSRTLKEQVVNRILGDDLLKR